MPLLLLPPELLLDIIGYIAASAPSTGPSPQSLGVLKGLAHTCQHLRDLAITAIYPTITVDSEVGKLGKLLIDYPHIAACVRKLTVCAPRLRRSDNRNLLLLRGVLSVCTKLRELLFYKPPSWNRGGRTGFEDGVLEHLATDSRNSIRMIEFQGLGLHSLLQQFRRILEGSFVSLENMRMPGCEVCNPYDVQRHREEQTRIMKILLEDFSTEWPGALGSVKTLLFDARFPYRLRDEPGVGVYFAKAMPNLKVFTMITSPDFIYGCLWAYSEMGSNLTELEITASYPSSISGRHQNPERLNPQRNHFCDIVVKLAPRLTKFTLRGNSEIRICHKVFSAGSWPKLTMLHVVCACGCEEINAAALRVGLLGLTQTRPRAYLYFEGGIGEDLVSWNTFSPLGVPLRSSFGQVLDVNFVAPLELFERLDPAPPEVEAEDEIYYGDEDSVDLGLFPPGVPDDEDKDDNWV